MKSGLPPAPVEAAHIAVKVAKAEIRLESFILCGVGMGIAGEQMSLCM